MRIHSSRRSRSKFKPVKQDLPLGTLTYETDPSTQERKNTVNPDLPAILGRYAYYLDQRKQDKLSQAIFKQWLFGYLAQDNSIPPKLVVTHQATNPAYELLSDRQTTATLFQKISDSVTGAKDSAHLVYLGLYLFAAWHFLIDSAEINVDPQFSDAVFNYRVRRYIAMKCQDWKWTAWSSEVIGIKPEFVLTPGTSNYTILFLKQTLIHNYWLQRMGNTDNLGKIDTFFDVPVNLALNFSTKNKMDAEFDFVTYFRSLFIDILYAEFSSLVCEIKLDLIQDIQNIGCYAVGEGGNTMGFFGNADLGNSFFNYEGDKAASANSFKTTNRYRSKLSREVTVWPGSGQGVPRIFLVQWGANGTNPNVCVTIGKSKSSKPIYVQSGPYLAKTDDSNFLYSQDTGLLTFKSRSSDPIALTYTSNTPSDLTQGDETVFFTLSYLSPTQPNTNPSPDPRLRIDTLFLDDEFVIPASVFSTFWTAAPQQAALDALILKMRDDPNFVIVSSILGEGIGLRIDMNGPDEFASDLVSAEDQTDNEVANTVAFENAYLRYAYGEAIWTTGVGGQPGVLNLCTEGYVSPLRCTWDSWAPFQLNTQQPEFDGNKKIDDLQNDIGQFLRPSLNRGPSYNTALSAFRAFGMTEAIVRKLQARAGDLDPSQLSDQQRDAIIATLDAFLNSQASCVLLQVGVDRECGVIIDYKMFRKYAY